MRFVLEAASLVKRLTFSEKSSNGIEWLNLILLTYDSLKVVHNRAIQEPHYKIGACVFGGGFICRKRQIGLLSNFHKRRMSRADKLYIFPDQEVETVPQVNDRTNNEGMRVVSATGFLLRPFTSTNGVVFPEIDTGSEPIEVAFAFQEFKLAIYSRET